MEFDDRNPSTRLDIVLLAKQFKNSSADTTLKYYVGSTKDAKNLNLDDLFQSSDAEKPQKDTDATPRRGEIDPESASAAHGADSSS